jgi:hypothetical protein
MARCLHNTDASASGEISAMEDERDVEVLLDLSAYEGTRPNGTDDRV